MKVVEIATAYIEYRKAVGDKFDSSARKINTFVRFIGLESDIAAVTPELCERYLSKDRTGSQRLRLDRHISLSGLFKWAVAREYMPFNPLPADRPQRPEVMKPYIYSRAELKSLFDNALTYQRRKSQCYPETMRAVLQVTYMLGLRISETLNLKMSDIDLVELVATIRESKFYRSRMTPFNQQAKCIIQHYLEWKRNVGQDCSYEAYLFVNKSGIKLSSEIVRTNFIKIRNDAGISRNDGAAFQPRIHDLRHTFAVNRLVAWYDAGEDVQKLLPFLSTYLGHTQLAHTSIYLTMTDRLLNLANNLFESFYEGGLKNE